MSNRIKLNEKVDFYVTYLRCLHYIEAKAKSENISLYEGSSYPVLYIKKEMSQYLRDTFEPDDDHIIFGQLIKYLEKELIKYGAITEFLQDENVKKIYIEGAKSVYIKVNTNKSVLTDVTFKNSVEVTKLINRLFVGKTINFSEENPYMEDNIDGIGKVALMHKSLHKDEDDHITIIKNI